MIEPLLPEHANPHPTGGGRPRVADRDCADAIFYLLRTGCQWSALAEGNFCAKSTAYDRFREWEEAGVFEKFWKSAVELFDELEGIGE